MANGRCYYHGGNRPVGPAHPNWKHGRYSKILPKGMFTERYQAAYVDPGILSLAPEIAVTDARIGELFLRLNTGETGKVWEQLSSTFAGFQSLNQRAGRARQREAAARITEAEAIKRDDAEAFARSQTEIADAQRVLAECSQDMGVLMAQIEGLIKRGGEEQDTWAEIGSNFEQRRKLVESERKRMMEQQQYMTLRDADNLFKAIIEAVADVETDRTKLQLIMRKVTTVVLNSGGPSKPREFLTEGIAVEPEPAIDAE